jgi:hypothetical protein
LRLSLRAPFMRWSARSLTLRLFLIFFSDLMELASLVVEAWRKKVRENQLRLCCSGISPDYPPVREAFCRRVGEVTDQGRTAIVGC